MIPPTANPSSPTPNPTSPTPKPTVDQPHGFSHASSEHMAFVAVTGVLVWLRGRIIKSLDFMNVRLLVWTHRDKFGVVI